MASVCKRPNGLRRVVFNHEGKRKTLYLGKVSQRAAEAVCLRIEELIGARDHAYSDELRRWIESRSEDLQAKLAAAGLIEKRQAATLGGFIDGFIEAREADTKASTRIKWGTVRNQLLNHFGPQRQLASITEADAEGWRLRLLREGRSDNTVRRACGIAKQWLAAAIRARLLTTNPFRRLVSTVRANPERFAFIDPATAERVIDACPDAEWRLLFALARYGGLRIPSEAYALRWCDIDWARDRFTVRSPKTEHHEGKASRVVPIFPELLPHLLDAWELAKSGEGYREDGFCIERYRGGPLNLRTQLARIIRRAGVKQWPKLWQNLRSTRQTELAERFPLQVVVAWIGNSQAVAMQHYLQTTDAHFEAAAALPPCAPGEQARDAQCNARSARTERKRTEPRSGVLSATADLISSSALVSELLETVGMGDKGLEPSTSRV